MADILAGIDEQTQKSLVLAVTTITVENLCKLLVEKGVITKDEHKKIADDANESLRKAFTGEKS